MGLEEEKETRQTVEIEGDKGTEIDVTHLDRTFADEVASKPGGEDIRRCLACGMCTAGCPVREVDCRYSPRRLIRMILLGMREEVLNSDFLWLCSNCFTCQERCPQGVRIPEIIRTVKNIAADEGHLPTNLQAVADTIAQIGRIYEVEDFDNKKRAKNDLPELEKDLADIDKLLEELKEEESGK